MLCLVSIGAVEVEFRQFFFRLLDFWTLVVIQQRIVLLASLPWKRIRFIYSCSICVASLGSIFLVSRVLGFLSKLSLMKLFRVATPCPVMGCGKPIKQIMNHANKMHRDLDFDEFKACFACEPFSYIRCPWCRFMTPSVVGMKQHRCGHRYGDTAPDMEVQSYISAIRGDPEASENGDIAVDIQGLAVSQDGDAHGRVQGNASPEFEGDFEDAEDERVRLRDDKEYEREGPPPDAAFAKQPALEALPAEGRLQYRGIACKLLGMIVSTEGTDAALQARACDAWYNLPGCLKNAEFRATGKAPHRKKVLGNVMKSLNRKSGTELLEAIEDLVSDMTARMSRIVRGRRQFGLEKDWEHTFDRVERMVHSGNLEGAMGLVSDWHTRTRPLPEEDQSQRRRSPAEIQALLEPMYPRATAEHDTVLSFEERCEDLRASDPEAVVPEAFQLDVKQTIASAISLVRGRAAGQSGHTNALLKTLAMDGIDDEFFPLLTKWFNLVLRNRGGPSRLWTVGRVALIDKPTGGYRSLAVGETLVRVLTRTVVFAKRIAASHILAPHQVSVGVKGGLEQLTQAFAGLSRLLENANGQLAIAATDVSNAYNCVQRAAAADAIWRDMPDIYPLFEWLYGTASFLVLASGATVAMIESGLRQGCPLASLVFNLTIRLPLVEAQKVAPSTLIMFYADDGNLKGPASEVKEAVMVLVEAFAKVGLSFNCAKSIYLDGQAPDGLGDTLEFMGVREDGFDVSFTRAEGAKICGRAVGSEQYVRESVAKTLKQQGDILPYLPGLPTDVALLLLTYCVNTRPTFLARNFPPSIVQHGLAEFDAWVDECLEAIAQTTGGEWAWWVSEVRALPVDLGGIGLPKLSHICEVAHVSCLVESLTRLQERFAYRPELIEVLRGECLSEEQLTLVSHSLPFLVENQRLRLPGEHSFLLPPGPVDLRTLYAEEMAKVKQSALARTLYHQKAAALKQSLLEHGEFERAAMLQSAPPHRKMSRWLRGGLFLNMHNRMAPDDFLECLRLRLLVHEYAGKVGRCGCRFKVPISDRSFRAHLLVCNEAGNEITYRHDLVVGILAKFCKKCVGDGGRVEEEVELPTRGNLQPCRLDLVVTTALGEEHIVDVTICNTMARSVVYGFRPAAPLTATGEGAAFVAGWAADQASKGKFSKAQRTLSPAQLARFTPFAVEVTGRLGGEAEALLKTMELCHNTRVGDGAQELFRPIKSNLLLELGMVIARGTARVMRKVRKAVVVREFPEADRVGEEDLDFYDANGDVVDGNEPYFIFPQDGQPADADELALH